MVQCATPSCHLVRKLLFMQRICRFSLAGIAKTIGAWAAHLRWP
jgi:hypothetical protein